MSVVTSLDKHTPCTASACLPTLYKATNADSDTHCEKTMRAAAISMPRLDKLPGMFFSANPKDLREPNHSLLDDKTQKKKPKTL